MVTSCENFQNHLEPFLSKNEMIKISRFEDKVKLAEYHACVDKAPIAYSKSFRSGFVN